MIFNKKIFLLSVIFTLVSCREEYTYTDLLKRPQILKQEVVKCEALSGKSNAEISQTERNHCETVMYAAANIISVINEEQDDPQKFGQKVMTAEMDYTKAKEQFSKAEQNLAALKSSHADQKELQVAEKKRVQAEHVYQKRQEEMNLLLLVLGLNSPE